MVANRVENGRKEVLQCVVYHGGAKHNARPVL
jgi:hypothetical protein